MMCKKLTMQYIIPLLCFLARVHTNHINQRNSSTVTVVYKTDTSTYCITNSSYAMAWNYVDIEDELTQSVSDAVPEQKSYTSLDCPLGPGYNCSALWKIHGWQESTSIVEGFSEPILDRRWEELDILKWTKDKNYERVLELVNGLFFKISFSVRKRNDAHLFLCDGMAPRLSNCYWFTLDGKSGSSTTSTIKRCPHSLRSPGNPLRDCTNIKANYTGPSRLDGGKWKHFTVEKNRHNLTLYEVRVENREQIMSFVDDEILDTNHFLILYGESPGLWKIHNYGFLKTTKPHPLQPLGPRPLPVPGYFAFSVYTFMCQSCEIHITLEINRTIYSNYTFRQSPDSDFWEEKKIIVENITGNLELNMALINSSGSDIFWMIDSIEHYSASGFRTLKANLKNPKSCQVLDSDHSIDILPSKSTEKDIKCDVTEFSSYCIPCQVANKSETCEKANVWEVDEVGQPIHSCTAGYMGQDCKKECTRSYGFNCSNECGQCEYRCNNTDGNCSNGCKNNFSGKKCTNPPGYILKTPPIVEKVSPTSASIRISRNSKDYYIPVGHHVDQAQYKIQIKELGANNWQIAPAVENSNIEPVEFVEFTIGNLEPETNYILRAIVYSNDIPSYEGDLVTNVSFATNCTDIEPSNISTEIADWSAKVILKGSNSVCNMRNYNVCINDDKMCIQNGTVLFSDLKPYTTYTLVFMKADRNLFQKNFTTPEAAPSEIQQVTYRTTQDELDLNWEKPKNENGKIKKYHIRYRFLHRACETNETDSGTHNMTTDRTNYILKSLRPYAVYLVNISAETVTEGPAIQIQLSTNESATILDSEVPTIINLKAQTKSATIQFDGVNCTNMEGPLYLKGRANGIEEWCKESSLSEQYSAYKDEYTVSGLSPFCNYTIEMEFCRPNDNARCHKKEFRKFVTQPDVPNPVSNMIIYSKGDQYISIRWKPPTPPTGVLKNYKVEFTNTQRGIRHNSTVAVKVCKLWPEFHCARITDNVESRSQYNVQIYARNVNPVNYCTYSPTGATYTVEEVPGAPSDIILEWFDDSSVNVSWKHPEVMNGDVKSFTITAVRVSDPSILDYIESMDFNSEDDYQISYHHKTKPLSPSTQYIVTILAFNNVSSSNQNRTDTSPPPKPSLKERPEFKEANSTIVISVPPMKKNSTTYTFDSYICILINGTRTAQNITPLFETEFRKHLADYNQYNVVHCGSHNVSENWKFTIGTNRTNTSFNYSNPPLQPNCSYKVIVYIFNLYENKTSRKIYDYLSSREHNSNVLSTNPKPEEVSPSNSGIHFVWLLIIPLILLPILCWMHKKRGPLCSVEKSNDEGESSDECDTVPLMDFPKVNPEKAIAVVSPIQRKDIGNSVNSKTGEQLAGIPNINNNSVVGSGYYSKSIPVVNLKEYVKNSIATRELEKQFSLLPKGQTKPWDYGILEENISKNRYRNVIAYDHTRIVLEKIPGDEYSDYINASYMDEYNIPRAYIATQGPKKSTVNDFWRMIWQENVKYIVMVANIYEGGKKKVEQYWPDDAGEFGDITVECMTEAKFADYELREFRVSHELQERNVQQLHFTSWPDHGVPRYPQSLVPFMRKVSAIPLSTDSPIVVHCSAGVGRTGTIILCDMSLRMAAREGAVDLLKCLEMARSHRPNMVDHYVQYTFAHLVVLECLMGPQTAIPCNNEMEATVAKLIQSEGVRKQLKYLEATAWYSKALAEIPDFEEVLPFFPEKNRNPAIIPENDSRVLISRYPPDDVSSSYINAVVVDGFRAPSMYIVTQQPMPNTVGDFWRLVAEKGITVIISLNSIDEKDKQTWMETHIDIFYKFDFSTSLPLNLRRDIWFMQDGTPPHYTLLYMKSPVYSQEMNNREELWEQIVNSANFIANQPNIFFKVRGSFGKSVDKLIQTTCQFWPTEDLPTMEPVDYITLEHIETISLNYCNIDVIDLNHARKEQPVSVEIIAMKNWPPDNTLPPSFEEFLSFWEETDKRLRESQVLVTCYDGATASGLYLAMSFLIKEMKSEQICDVCQAVRNIRYSRKQFITSQEQYQFLLEASVKYFKQFQFTSELH